MEYIFENMRVGNALQPSQEQVDKLIEYKTYNGLDNSRMTNNVWLRAFNHGLLFDDCPEKIQDQEYRAKIIVDNLLKYDLKKLVLFDGHGRMYWCILNDLKTRGLNIDDYHFYFYEIDKETHYWHNEYFPLRNCCNIFENIFESSNIFSNAFYYLNFCGIGNCHNELYEFLKTMINDLPVLMSCSRRSTNHRKNKTKTLLWNINRNLKMEKVCYLKLFDTYLIQNKST